MRMITQSSQRSRRERRERHGRVGARWRNHKVSLSVLCETSAPSAYSPANSAYSRRRGYVRGSVLFAVVIIATVATLLWPGADALTGRTTLLFTVWGMPFEDRLFLDRYAKGWEALHPDIRVDYQRYGEDLEMKYNAWHTRGRGADVMRLRVTAYHGMVERGMLEPLDRWIADPQGGLSGAELAEFPAHLMEIVTLEGPRAGVYALPEDNAQLGLFYNKAIFDRHNAEHPADRVEYPRAGWTWDDLRRTARTLTRFENGDAERGRITQAGFDFVIWAWPFINFFAQAGGQLWSEDGLTCLVDSGAGVEALTFLRAMQREDRSYVAAFGYQSGTGPDAKFAAGRTAMYLDGSWRVPNFDLVAPDLDFAVAPPPRGKVPAVVSGSVLWAISAHSEHKAEAWAMLRWLVAREQALQYWDTLRVAPPAHLGALKSEDFKETRGVLKDPADPSRGYEVPPMARAEYEDKAAWILYANTPHPETGRPPGFVPVHPLQADLELELQRMLTEFLRPEATITAEEALGRVVRNMHTLIDNDRRARGMAAVAR